MHTLGQREVALVQLQFRDAGPVLVSLNNQANQLRKVLRLKVQGLRFCHLGPRKYYGPWVIDD